VKCPLSKFKIETRSFAVAAEKWETRSVFQGSAATVFSTAFRRRVVSGSGIP
jgi:hypothetical protein